MTGGALTAGPMITLRSVAGHAEVAIRRELRDVRWGMTHVARGMRRARVGGGRFGTAVTRTAIALGIVMLVVTAGTAAHAVWGYQGRRLMTRLARKHLMDTMTEIDVSWRRSSRGHHHIDDGRFRSIPGRVTMTFRAVGHLDLPGQELLVVTEIAPAWPLEDKPIAGLGTVDGVAGEASERSVASMGEGVGQA